MIFNGNVREDQHANLLMGIHIETGTRIECDDPNYNNDNHPHTHVMYQSIFVYIYI